MTLRETVTVALARIIGLGLIAWAVWPVLLPAGALVTGFVLLGVANRAEAEVAARSRLRVVRQTVAESHARARERRAEQWDAIQQHRHHRSGHADEQLH